MKTIKPILAAALLCVGSGCSGCYSLPDGEVERVDGAEVVERVMRDYGDGLGPGPEEGSRKP